MKFQTLMESISLDFPIQYAANEENSMNITNIEFLDGTQEAFQYGTLYFGHYAQVNEHELPPQCMLAVRFPDADMEMQGNVAFVPEDALYMVFNRCKKMILDRAGIEDLIAELCSQTAGKDLQSLLNFASVRLSNSFIVLDASYKVLATSTVFPITDTLWAGILERGYCTYEFTRSVAQLPGIADMPDKDDAYVVTCQASPIRKLYSKIIHRNKQAGCLVMLEQESQISSLHIEIMPHLSRAVAEMFSHNPAFHMADGSEYENLLYDMLIGAGEKDIHGRIIAANMQFDKTMCALCVQNSRYLGQMHMRSHVSERLKKVLPGTHLVLYEECIAALVPLGDQLQLEADRINQLTTFAHSAFARVGISDSFTDVLKFTKYFAQARQALSLSERIGNASSVCLYERYSFFDLLHRSPHQQLGAYCHPALGRLNRYDQQHETDLYHTLRVYLDQGGNLKRTAEALYIHRNSLAYCLARIREVAAVDLDDQEIRFLLAVAYRIDCFQGMG
ncbi:PucR family transcriptional regulator [Muricomes intestini]|uniref:PucR family transcriptional regulator n=1 Tax=Muricomes intestini TaxID=1796634 RepID=UPI000E9D7C76|nr:hypothetical protein [Lachnospiraceae bacterium]